jgi:hypothetical protein
MQVNSALVLGSVICSLGSTAQAVFVDPFVTIEAESNNSPASAQNVEPGRVFDAWDTDFTNFFTSTVAGSIEPGDVDYYRIDTAEGLPHVTLMDIHVAGPVGASVQLLVLDGETGSVIDFVSAPGGVFQFCRLDDGANPSLPRTYVFAVSAGNDLDPANSNPNLPFGLGPLLGSSALFDGNDFETGQAHGATFSYTLTFLPGFVPAPGAGCLLLLAGGVCVCSRRR